MDFDNVIGAIVLFVTAVVSIVASARDKKKKAEEAAEQRRIAAETKRSGADELSETARRQIYGDPKRPFIQTAQPAQPRPGVPVPPPLQPTVRRTMMRPPALPENPTPSAQPATPGTILVDWLQELERKTMQNEEGPERKTMVPPQPQPQRRVMQQPQQLRRQRPPAIQPQTASVPEVSIDRGARSVESVAASAAAQVARQEYKQRRIRETPCGTQMRAILRSSRDVRAGLILREILGPPKALQ
jgi:hypothetical protein